MDLFLARDGSVARITHVGAPRICVVSEGLVKRLTYVRGIDHLAVEVDAALATATN
ncbi:MAG: hypothetical protein IT371_05225 [Deltaproteobacteria bacterium]|nr:hypothetical protein [Deltaproteobacteria bacterium]